MGVFIVAMKCRRMVSVNDVKPLLSKRNGPRMRVNREGGR